MGTVAPSWNLLHCLDKLGLKWSQLPVLKYIKLVIGKDMGYNDIYFLF